MGRSGLGVNPLVLGTMTFGTVRWGSGDDVPEGVFNAYEDAGGNFADTANVYSGGKSEEMLGGYIAGRHLRDQVVLATKLGSEVSDGEKCTGKLNGRPEYARKSIERSLRDLGTDYGRQCSRPAPPRLEIPVEDSMGMMSRFVEEGEMRFLGLSEVSGDIKTPNDFGANDSRRWFPRYQGENFYKNLALVEKLQALAQAKGVTAAQLALAWVLAQGVGRGGHSRCQAPPVSGAERGRR